MTPEQEATVTANIVNGVNAHYDALDERVREVEQGVVSLKTWRTAMSGVFAVVATFFGINQA